MFFLSRTGCIFRCRQYGVGIMRFKYRLIGLATALAGALIAAGCGGESGPTIEEMDAVVAQQAAAAATLEVTSTAFVENDRLPEDYVCQKTNPDGQEKWPPLMWSGVPRGTRSIALVLEDADFLGGPRAYWVAYAIPPDVTGLPEAASSTDPLPAGARHGINDVGLAGYSAPCPPLNVIRKTERGAKKDRQGGSLHQHFYRVYALDVEIALAAGATKMDLLQAMDGHILAAGQLMARYNSPPIISSTGT